MRWAALTLVALLAGCVPGQEDDPPTEQTGAQAAEQAQAASDGDASSEGETADGPGGEAAPLGLGGPQIDPITLLPAPGSTPEPVPMPSDQRPVPHIYVSLQHQGESRPVSVIFAIDDSRDGNPSDDPAIRLTPENGQCNPQAMRQYNFPDADADRPVVTEADRSRGLTAANLPSVMAVVVTERMIAQGLARTPEETRAQNVCTRKLWEELVLTENQAGTTGQVASGQ